MTTHLRKTKLLLANDHLGWDNQIHGVARLFRLWGMYLDQSKYNVTVCILRRKNGLSATLEQQGIHLTFGGKSKYDPTSLFEFVKMIKREKIDIMHIQSYGATTFGRLAGIITGVPVIVHFHDIAPYYPWIQKVSDRLLGKFTDAYIAVSHSVKDLWAGRCRLDPNKIIMMHNCTSLEEFKPLEPAQIETEKKRLGIPQKYNVVGTVTRLFESKGAQYLLLAASLVLKTFPETMFVIVGDGPERNQLETLSERLGLRNHVLFTGYTERIAPILGTFDIKVLTSYCEGGSPLPVIEAMAMEKAVIVTDLVEVVEDGTTGLVIPPRDSDVLARKIIYLLKNREEANRLAKNAGIASKKYDAKDYVRKLERIYDSLLVKKERGVG